MFPCFLYVLKLLKMTCRDPPVHELLLIMDPRQPRRGIVPQQLLSGLDQGGGAWAQQAGPEHIRRKPIIFTQTLACACVCVFTITPGSEIEDWNQVPGTLSWGDSWVGLLGDQLIIQKKKSGQCTVQYPHPLIHRFEVPRTGDPVARRWSYQCVFWSVDF